MTFYDRLNYAIEYIEVHLDSEINPAELTRITGTSFSTLRRLFPLLTNISFADYLRQRRLSSAGRDLVQTNLRIIDIATKYGYTSSSSFSRAFTKFHGLKPSEVRNCSTKLKYYSKLSFNNPIERLHLEYEVIEYEAPRLYGTGIKTDEAHIRHDAPQFFLDTARQRQALGSPEYGMVVYNNTRCSSDNYEYWVLWPHFSPNLSPYTIAARRWLKFRIHSQQATDIQAMSDHFYKNFLPTCEYELAPEPELEHYHDGVTDFLVPIR